MYCSRRNGQLNDVHNNRTNMRMTTSALSLRPTSHSNRHASRSKSGLNGAYPCRSPSKQVCIQ